MLKNVMDELLGNETNVLKIKKMIKDGYKNNEIAEIYNVDTSNISLIRTGKRWSHVNI